MPTNLNEDIPHYIPSRYTLTLSTLNSKADKSFTSFSPVPSQYISCIKTTQKSRTPAQDDSKNTYVLFHPFRPLLLSVFADIVALYSYEEGRWTLQYHFQEPQFSPFDDASVLTTPEITSVAWLDDLTFVVASTSPEIRVISLSTLSVVKNITLTGSAHVSEIKVPKFHSKIFICRLSNNRIQAFHSQTGSLVLTTRDIIQEDISSIDVYYSQTRLCLYFVSNLISGSCQIYKIPLIDFEYLEVQNGDNITSINCLELEDMKVLLIDDKILSNSRLSFINDYMMLGVCPQGVFVFTIHDALISMDRSIVHSIRESCSFCWVIKSSFEEVILPDKKVLTWHSDDYIPNLTQLKPISISSHNDLIVVGLPTGQVLMFSVSSVLEALCIGTRIDPKWLVEIPPRYYNGIASGYIRSVTISNDCKSVFAITEGALVCVWQSLY